MAIIPQLTIQYTVQPAEMFLWDNVSRVALFVGNKNNQCASLLEDLKYIQLLLLLPFNLKQIRILPFLFFAQC